MALNNVNTTQRTVFRVTPLGIGLAAFLFIVGLIFFISFAPFTIIPNGHSGVITVFGSLNETPLQPGFHFVNPVAKVTKLNVQIEKIEGKFDGASKDLQSVTTDMVINIQLSPNTTPTLYKQVGVDYVNKIVNPAASEVLKAELALHNATDILAKRQVVKDAVQKGISVWLKKYDIDVKEVSLANIRFSQQYEHAVEQKQLEEQKALQKTYELQQAELDAKIRATKAKGEADAAIAAASGEAESLKVKGQAQAEYNEKVAKSLTSSLLQQKYYEKWDGKLPQMLLGDKTGTLIQVPTN